MIATKLSKINFDDVMGYEHIGVIERIKKEFKREDEDAKELFNDMKRFLIISSMTSEVISPTKPIDDAWHTFILFTKDYMDFCNKYLGRFIHHKPFDERDDAEQGINGLIHAIKLVKSIFQEPLSKNWDFSTYGDNKCSPTPNCESPPSDCALNVDLVKNPIKNMLPKCSNCSANCAAS